MDWLTLCFAPVGQVDNLSYPPPPRGGRRFWFDIEKQWIG
jgi:hypothetical protein